jgi:hypothetical protein
MPLAMPGRSPSCSQLSPRNEPPLPERRSGRGGVIFTVYFPFFGFTGGFFTGGVLGFFCGVLGFFW